jgi:hypothetical protein
MGEPMAQYSFIKSAGGVLIPATPDAQAFINSKVKLGAVLYADFKQARNPAFHRKSLRFSISALITGSLPAAQFLRQIKSWFVDMCNLLLITQVMKKLSKNWQINISVKRQRNVPVISAPSNRLKRFVPG